MKDKRIINNSGVKMYVVTEDGLLVDEIDQGDRIVRKESVEAYNDKQRRDEEMMDWNPESDHIKVFSKGIENISGELKISDFNTILKLVRFINYESGLLGKKGQHGKLVPLLFDDMVELSGLSRRTFLPSMDRLIQEKVFAKARAGKNTLYYANPFIFMKGKRINTTLFSMFKNYKYK